VAASPRILAVANQKGGVGKTTTAINLCAALVAIGCRVLLIDMDPQGNASTGLGVPVQKRVRTSYDVLMGDATIAETVVESSLPNLGLVPGDADLSGVEVELGRTIGRAFRLRDAIAASGAMAFDYVLIDCPPSLNLLTVNAFAAADAVLAPLQCEFFALEGLSQLLRTVEEVRVSLNPRLDLQGVVLTMFDRRNSLANQVARDVRAHLKDKVYATPIPRNVRVSEAPSFGLPAIIYDLNCAGSRAYLELAKEFLARERAAAALEPIS
jgi:chromosome partitioning protein